MQAVENLYPKTHLSKLYCEYCVWRLSMAANRLRLSALSVSVCAEAWWRKLLHIFLGPSEEIICCFILYFVFIFYYLSEKKKHRSTGGVTGSGTGAGTGTAAGAADAHKMVHQSSNEDAMNKIPLKSAGGLDSDEEKNGGELMQDTAAAEEARREQM